MTLEEEECCCEILQTRAICGCVVSARTSQSCVERLSAYSRRDGRGSETDIGDGAKGLTYSGVASEVSIRGSSACQACQELPSSASIRWQREAQLKNPHRHQRDIFAA